jgi:hypothetical protein
MKCIFLFLNGRVSPSMLYRFKAWHSDERLEIAGFHQFQKSRLSLAIRQQHDFAKHAAFAQHLVRVARAFDW